jgi:hypothetical protein
MNAKVRRRGGRPGVVAWFRKVKGKVWEARDLRQRRREVGEVRYLDGWQRKAGGRKVPERVNVRDSI